MEVFKVQNLSFKYPMSERKTLDNVSIDIKKGDFLTICGKSGSGKSTFLKLFKPSVEPFGEKDGEIYYYDKKLSELTFFEQSQKIGFVGQNPESQIVTDMVWHELAFGAESLGLSNNEIRMRVAETSMFFGIEEWFHKKVIELSGGQKQILNLASVMVMHPEILILDEPTAQLDPIAAETFLEMLAKINKDIGTTVIIAEHRLERVFELSNNVLVLENGSIAAQGSPQIVGKILKNIKNDMQLALPTAMRSYLELENGDSCPLTVREGRKWLEEFSKKCNITSKIEKKERQIKREKTVLEINNIWFRYERNEPDIIKGLSLNLYEGEILAIVGGNGAGKTTLVSLISEVNRTYRGRVKFHVDKKAISVLPQNPQLIFLKSMIKLDLLEIIENSEITPEEKATKLKEISKVFEIEEILEKHPYDVSGGELQRAALAKLLLNNPSILIMDEPTKGMDAHFKLRFLNILKSLKDIGVTVVLVSHDIEFCARCADRCAMLFDGGIISEGEPELFFTDKLFYTTAAGRMAQGIIPNVILEEDISAAFKQIKRKEYR